MKEPSVSEKKAMRAEGVEQLSSELKPQLRDGYQFELKVAIARLMAGASQLPKPY